VNLREREVFNASMRAGTTVGAGNLLFLSQSAVSKILKHLDSRTGLNLFERVSGRLRPTPEGRTLYRHVRNVFARLETIDRIAQDIKGGRNGVISVAATPTIGNTLLAEAVARFRRLHLNSKVIFRSIRTPDVALHDPFTLLAGNAPDLVMRKVQPSMRISVQLLFSREHPSSSIATRQLEKIRAVAGEMAQRLANTLAAPGRIPSRTDRPGRSETARERALTRS
jgi:DNA-binding transcriptional LysR family regulator